MISFAALRVDMFVSHDLVPALGWSIASAAVAWIVSRSRRVAAAVLALVMMHYGCDLLSGMEHHVLGKSTQSVGLALYTRMPVAALAIEIVFTALCLVYFMRLRAAKGIPVAGRQRTILLAVFLIGSALWLPTANASLNDWITRILGN